MTENDDIIFDSPTSDPEDEFWLEQGKRMVTESLEAVRSAANALITALGVIQGIYLGILGFSKFIPEKLSLLQKMLFFLPLLIWLISLYCCICVVMTRKLMVFFHSPDDIREKSTQFMLEKQRQLQWGFWLLAGGLMVAFLLFAGRLYL